MKFFHKNKRYLLNHRLKAYWPNFVIYPLCVIAIGSGLLALQAYKPTSVASPTPKPDPQASYFPGIVDAPGVSSIVADIITKPSNGSSGTGGSTVTNKPAKGTATGAASSTSGGGTATTVGGTAPASSGTQHSNIITTIFWAGEPADSDNGNISNVPSAWDEQWETHYGGIDAQTPRNGYYPAAFTPKENPFYFALPYSDYDDNGNRKSTATNCANSGVAGLQHYSWCKNTWIQVTYGGKTVYAQWEDVGPFEEDDTAYVFGSAAPKNKQEEKAGLDVSPAVQTYLGISDVSKTSWSFISASSIPSGPWTNIITTDKGDSN